MNRGISAWLQQASPDLVALRGQGTGALCTFGDFVELTARLEALARNSGATGIICNGGLGLKETIVWAVVAQTMELPCVLGGSVVPNEEMFALTPRQPFSHYCNGLEIDVITSSCRLVNARSKFQRDAVVLLTSGTTGEPKLAMQRWGGLLASIRRGSSLNRTKWLLTYSPTRFAGIQVWLHSLANEGTLIFADHLGVNPLIELLFQHRPDMISATPTFWRHVLRSVSPVQLSQYSPQAITLGGEAADQALLENLQQLFPRTRIVQIYASTEAGVGITVTDGKEGLPASILEHGYEGNQFKIVQGELHVLSQARMQGYLSQPSNVILEDGFLATGDMVHMSGERILFLGRKDGRFNVGGHKVDPMEIERHALTVAGVSLAQVYGRKSPVLGEIPALRFVAAPGYSHQEVTESLHMAFKDFPPYKIPRLIESVPDLEMTDTGKTRRT